MYYNYDWTQNQQQPGLMSGAAPMRGAQAASAPPLDYTPTARVQTPGMNGSGSTTPDYRLQGQSGGMDRLKSDYTNYFNTYGNQPGSSIDWMNGKLTMGPNQLATYQPNNGGRSQMMGSNYDVAGVAAANPYIRQQWSQQYGVDPHDLGQYSSARDISGGWQVGPDGNMIARPSAPPTGPAYSAGPSYTDLYQQAWGMGQAPTSDRGTPPPLRGPGATSPTAVQGQMDPAKSTPMRDGGLAGLQMTPIGNSTAVNGLVGGPEGGGMMQQPNRDAAAPWTPNYPTATPEGVSYPYYYPPANNFDYSKTVSPEFATNTSLYNSVNTLANWKTPAYPQYTPSERLGPSMAPYADFQDAAGIGEQYISPWLSNAGAASPWSGQAKEYQQTSRSGAQAPNTNITTPQFQWTGSTAAPQWQQTGLQSKDVNSPYQSYGGADPGYQKMGASPEYSGLMGQDYDALQTALQTPGDLAAKQARDKGQLQLNEVMGGKGLYGSSIMANQQREALDQPYMQALQTNAANAAAQRYGMQASDLQNQNQFGLNVYGQQMGENAAANAQGVNTWQSRLGENLSGQGYGLEAQKANQQANTALQGLLSNQGLAQNSQNLSVYGQKLAEQTARNQAFQGNQALAQQGQIAQGQLGTDIYGKKLGDIQAQDVTNLQNIAQQQDVQKAMNAYNQNIYGLNIGREQNQNDYGLGAAQLGVQQNQNLYTAGQDYASRLQDYQTNRMNYQNQESEAYRNWANRQGLEQFQYALSNRSDTQAQQENYLNAVLALAGKGAPLSAANQNYQLAQQQMQQQRDIAGQQSMSQLGSGVLGMLGNLGAMNLYRGNNLFGY